MIFKSIQKLTGHNAAVYQLINVDDDYFISLSGDGMIVKWSKDINNQDGRLIARDNTSIFTGYFDRTSNLLYVGNILGNISIIDIENHRILNVYKAHRNEIYDIIKVEDSILSCGKDGTVTIYDYEQGKIEKVIQLSSFGLRTMHQLEREILVGASDGFLYSFFLHSDEIVRRKISNMSIFCINPLQDKLFLGGRDCKLHVLRKRDKKETSIIDAHTGTINHISSIKDLIITASRDKSIRIWTEDLQLVQSVHTIHGGHLNSVNYILPVDANSFYTCSDDRSIMRWSIE